MKRGQQIIYAFTLLLILCAVVVGKSDRWNYDFPFALMVTADGQTHKITCFQKYGVYYASLPAYTQHAEVVIQTNPRYEIRIGDQLLTDGMKVSQFPLGKQLDLFYDAADDEPDNTITFLRSGNVGTVYLDVYSGSMDYIHQKKGNKEGGSIQVYGADGTLWHSGKVEAIRGRGNATWLWEKKPYSLTLSKSADLLGMGAAKEWILLTNAPDPTHLRNKIAYDLAAEVGLLYSPESNWVDLYLNGEYTGLYLLTERNEIHPQRISTGNGTFLVSMELESRLKNEKKPYIRTNRGTILRIHQSDLTQQSIRQIWESAENAIFAEDGIDVLTGKLWTELIDVDSWAKKYLLEEIMGNYDAGSVSQYFYYDTSTGKIYAGPVWDMDNTMGNSYWTGAFNEILAGREHLWSDEDSPLYFALLEKDYFLNRVKELFRNVYQPAVNQLCNSKLDGYVQTISESANMNHERWPDTEKEIDAEGIREYLLSRMSFLESYLENREKYVTVHAWIPGNIIFCRAILPGECIEQLDDHKAYAWFDLETGIRFDFESPVYHNLILQKRLIAEQELDIP